MEKFVARTNIDHFLDLLERADGFSEKTSALNALLIEEANKLGRNPGQFAFTESRVERYRHHFAQLAHWRDGFEQGSADRVRAEKVLADFEITLKVVESICSQMRKQSGDL